MKIVRVMCTGRVDLSFIFRALSNGADGVFVGGCWPGECHYLTEGNYDALSNMYLCKKLMEHIGIAPGRLRLEWVSAAEGSRFAEVMNDFVTTLKELGPLDKGEEEGGGGVAFNLEAVQNLIPYIKLVEREKLRIPIKSEDAYKEFYTSDECDGLFKDLIAEKIAISRITLLLKNRPLSIGGVAEALTLEPPVVSRHLNNASRQGLVRFDRSLNCYALARGETAGVG